MALQVMCVGQLPGASLDPFHSDLGRDHCYKGKMGGRTSSAFADWCAALVTSIL